MESEIKWLIGFIFLLVLIFPISLGVNAYIDHTCKVEAIKAARTVDEIVKICR